jgi:hypothetical protein
LARAGAPNAIAAIAAAIMVVLNIVLPLTLDRLQSFGVAKSEIDCAFYSVSRANPDEFRSVAIQNMLNTHRSSPFSLLPGLSDAGCVESSHLTSGYRPDARCKYLVQTISSQRRENAQIGLSSDQRITANSMKSNL